jgi:hypothetical protein
MEAPRPGGSAVDGICETAWVCQRVLFFEVKKLLKGKKTLRLLGVMPKTEEIDRCHQN